MSWHDFVTAKSAVGSLLGTKKKKKRETPNFSIHNYTGSRDWLTCAYSVPGSDSEQNERLLHTTPCWHSSQDGAEQPIKQGAGSRQGTSRTWDHRVGGCCKNNRVFLSCSSVLLSSDQHRGLLLHFLCPCHDVGDEGETAS